MRTIYENMRRISKTTLLTDYTTWLERFINKNKEFSDLPSDPVLKSQTGEDLINASIASLFSSLVIGLAERIGFKDFEFESGKIIWSTLLNLSASTTIRISMWEENESDYTRIVLVEPRTGELELKDVVEVYMSNWNST